MSKFPLNLHLNSINLNQSTDYFHINKKKNVSFHQFADITEAIKCYRCTVQPSYRVENRTQQLCAQFTESDEFTIDCPYSTMCLKKVFWYTLQDGTKIETVSRSCADQKYTEQVSQITSFPFVRKCYVWFVNDVGDLSRGDIQ